MLPTEKTTSGPHQGSAQINVPPGLREMLHDLVVHILRKQPASDELYQTAIDFLTMKKSDHRKHTSQDDEDEDDVGPMQPPPKPVGRRQAVAAESYDPEKADENYVKVVHPKSAEQAERLRHATQHIILFRCLDEDQMNDVIDAMFERKVVVGETVIKHGDDGDNFYVIESGKYDIIVPIDGVEKNVGQYDNKGSFGELALMYNTPRAATILAKTEGVLWAMARDVFHHIVQKSAFDKRRLYEDLLERVPMLKTLSSYERMNVADALKGKIYKDGDLIIKQGDPGDEMYFVEDGQVSIVMQRKGESETKQVAMCNKGDYFGELALLTSHPRAASAYAVGKAKLAVLDVDSFERLLGTCTDLLKRNITNYEDKLVEIFGSLDKVPEMRK